MPLDRSIDFSASAGFQERRREPRAPTNWIAKVRLADGVEIACTVKDVSKSGARLGIPEKLALPETFQLQVVGYEFRFAVRRVWRGGNSAGVRFDAIEKGPLPAPPEAPKPPAAEQPEGYTALATFRRRFSSR